MKRLPGLPSPGAKTAASILILAFVFLSFSLSLSADFKRGGNPLEDHIWKGEESYFTNLYRADYDGVLAFMHPQFLGWPGNLPAPINKEQSARFMKKLIPKPTACAVRIARAGFQHAGDAVITQYTLHVDCPDASGAVKTTSSRITHTWAQHKGRWLILGGMSIDVKQEKDRD